MGISARSKRHVQSLLCDPELYKRRTKANETWKTQADSHTLQMPEPPLLLLAALVSGPSRGERISS